MLNLVTALAYHFVALPAAFTQPGDHLLAEPCTNWLSLQVRGLTNMCSAPLDLFSMLELGGQTQPSNAMVAMNQLTAAGHGGQYLAAVNR